MMAIKLLIGSIWLWLSLGLLAIVVLLSSLTQKPSIEVLSIEERNQDWQATDFTYQPATESQIAQLNTNKLWGLEDKQNADTQTSKPWTLKGIIKDSDEQIAIIEIDQNATDPAKRFGRFKEGEALPNGPTLIKIYKDRVEYEIAGVVNVKRLYE